MGGSLFATLPAVSRLAQQGYPVQAMESAELLHYGSATLRAGDVGVVVSRSGGSIEPFLLAEKMRQAGMTVVGVTNVPGSNLEQIADITLPIGSQADKLIAVQTYTGTVLALCCWRRRCWPGKARSWATNACCAAGAFCAHRRMLAGKRELAGLAHGRTALSTGPGTSARLRLRRCAIAA